MRSFNRINPRSACFYEDNSTEWWACKWICCYSIACSAGLFRLWEISVKQRRRRVCYELNFQLHSLKPINRVTKHIHIIFKKCVSFTVKITCELFYQNCQSIIACSLFCRGCKNQTAQNTSEMFALGKLYICRHKQNNHYERYVH